MINQLPVKQCCHCGGEDIRGGWQSDVLVTFKRNGLLGKKKAIAAYLRDYPGMDSKRHIAGEVGVSRDTVHRYYDEIRAEFAGQA